MLIYDPFPTASQLPADVVYDQRNFRGNAANDDDQDGNAVVSPTDRTLAFPTGVFISNDQLFITDSGNNRMLIFDR